MSGRYYLRMRLCNLYSTVCGGSRNCRLAALRRFFGFVAGREPTAVEQCVEIMRIQHEQNVVRAEGLEPSWAV